MKHRDQLFARGYVRVYRGGSRNGTARGGEAVIAVGEMFESDRLTFADEDGMLDHAPELAHVPVPPAGEQSVMAAAL